MPSPVNCEMPVTVVPPAPAAPVRAGHESAKRIPVHIWGGNVPDSFCELIGIEAGTLYVRSDSQIPESSAIVVSFDHVQLSGVVAGCHGADGKWVISVGLSLCKRRLEERIPSGEASVIGIIEGDRTTVSPCRVTDASSYGLGLRVSSPMDIGARVYVETVSMMVLGEVRHCRSLPDGEFSAGILIVDVVPDHRSQNVFSVMLNNLRWKLASSVRGKDVPAYRFDR